MDKKTFLEELERSLQILEEEELRDIIGEYEQHIDMKVAKGLGEEEAIQDFGKLEDLKEQILKAYHVRADYTVNAETVTGQADGVEKREMRLLRTVQETLKKVSIAAGRAGSASLRKLRQFFTALCALVRKPFAVFKNRTKQRESAENSFTEKKGGLISGMGKAGGSLARWTGRTSSGLVHWSLKTASWCIRMFWNLCVIGLALCIGVVGVFFLYGLGMLSVLLASGYPLAGVTLACLGITMCLFALTGFGFTLLWRSRKTAERQMENDAPSSTQTEEEQHA